MYKLLCLSRLYKGGEILQPTEPHKVGDVTSATARIEVTATDNRAEVMCQVYHAASPTPQTKTSRLNVLCKYIIYKINHESSIK